MRGFEFEPAAAHEYHSAIEKTADAYGTGVAKRFIERFESALRRIRRFPESAIEVDPPFRCCSLLYFPYGIIYRYDETTVYIVALIYQRSKPGYWKDRLKDLP
jgi:toxin ParE1/3/4